jgi:hypothetical protein
MQGIHQQPYPVKTEDFSKGMDDRNEPWLIAVNAAPYLQNFNIQRAGAATRRDGTTSIGAASGATNVNLPYGLFKFFDRKTFDTEVLYSVYGNKAFLFPGNSQVLEKACGASLTSALHMASRGIWTVGGTIADTIFISNAQLNDSNVSLASKLLAIDVDQQFSANVSMAPLCTTWWQGRLWVGGNRLAETTDTLWWSALNDGLSYSLTNSARIEPGRGGRITGLHPPRAQTNRLLIFKEDMIAVLEVYWGSSSSQIPGPSDALDTIASSIRVVSENIGCVATRSIQGVAGAPAGDIFFLAKDGVRAISRATDDTISGAALPVSARIQTQIDRINYQYAHKAVSGVWNQMYHLAVPMDGATENSHVLSYDFINDAWHINTWDAKDFAVARLNQTQDRLLLQNNVNTLDSTASGLTQGWHVFRTYSGGVDPNNEAVKFQMDTRAYGFGSLANRKRWSWFGIHAENDTATSVIDVFYRVDDGDWVFKESVTFPVAGGNLITLGTTPLPWQPQGAAINMRKVGLEDVPVGYLIQFRLGQTSVTDFGHPSILMTAASARVIDPEFDNSIT